MFQTAFFIRGELLQNSFTLMKNAHIHHAGLHRNDELEGFKAEQCFTKAAVYLVKLLSR